MVLYEDACASASLCTNVPSKTDSPPSCETTQVGLTLAEHCDRYAVSQTRNLEPGGWQYRAVHDGVAVAWRRSTVHGQGWLDVQQGPGHMTKGCSF